MHGEDWLLSDKIFCKFSSKTAKCRNGMVKKECWNDIYHCCGFQRTSRLFLVKERGRTVFASILSRSRQIEFSDRSQFLGSK